VPIATQQHAEMMEMRKMKKMIVLSLVLVLMAGAYQAT
jgi:hypothetical protein